MLGMHGSVYANYAVNEADLLLAFGVRFDDRVTGKVSEFAKHGKIVHIDIDPSEINKNKAAHIPIVSDIKYALAELNKVVEPPEDSERVARADRGLEKERPVQVRQERPLDLRAVRDPQAVGADQGPRHDHHRRRRPASDVGGPVLQAQASRTPGVSSSGLGTMGFGLPAAMGAKAAHPDKLVIDIDGDGSFLMNIQELATCFCEKLPVKVLLLNNQHLGMVVQWEDRFHAGNRAHTYLGPIDHPEAIGQGTAANPAKRYPDFVTIAKGLWLRLCEGKVGTGRRPRRDDRLRRPLRARRRSALPGARAADDPRRHDGQGFDQGGEGGGGGGGGGEGGWGGGGVSGPRMGGGKEPPSNG